MNQKLDMHGLPDLISDILGNDRCVAFACRTPAGGVALSPMTTLGMHDFTEGTVTATTSFANFAKLRHVDHDDRVAIIYHARDHSPFRHPHLIVVQGRASFPDRADGQWASPEAIVRLDEFLKPRHHGTVWNWIGREYYEARVPITVKIHRVLVFDDDKSVLPSLVIGVALPEDAPSQSEPKNGTGPRIKARKIVGRLKKSRHQIVAWTDAEGFPIGRRVKFKMDGDMIEVHSAGLPTGSRRAGALAHWFGPQCVPQGSAVITGWLSSEGSTAMYAPHTIEGYVLPNSELAYHLGGGLFAKVRYRKAVSLGYIRDGVWQR